MLVERPADDGHHDLSKSIAGDKSDGTSGNSDATNVINNDEEEAEHERQPKQKLIVRMLLMMRKKEEC